MMSVFTLTSAKTYTPVGRYLTEQNEASASQTDPLQETFKITFPTTIKTIGKAMTYLLSNTGYSLAPKTYQSTEARDLFQQKLPLSDRQFGVMTVQQGMLALAGNTYQMLIDPERRYISFQLYWQYRKLYQADSLRNR